MKRTILIPLFLFFFISFSVAFAQTPEITNGLNYLETTQNPDGSWGRTDTSINTDFYSTAVTLETLKILNETGSQAHLNGVQWLNDYPVENAGYVAWKILSLSDENIDLTADLNLLLQWQNDDGGCGGYLNYTSSNFHTALALLALNKINYPDLETISYALNYLITNQNDDGGFGFRSDDESNPSTSSGSNVYMTALVLKVLASYRETFYVQDSIDNAIAYLLSKQNPDGAISTNTSTIFETALALDALITSAADLTSVAQPAIDYLINNQFPNGSWNDDPYSTALALRALAQVKPNLTISTDDITFSNPAPTVGDTITITATITNNGLAQTENILVQFYDGHPSSGGVLIEETAIPAIQAFGNAQTNINWTIPSATTQVIYVTVDPLNSIDEQDETDNTAYKNLTSATLPDLSIVSADIVFDPSFPVPGETVTTAYIVRNTGETKADNVSIDIYIGDPLSGGENVSNGTVESIGPGSYITVYHSSSFSGGNHDIYMVVDEANAIEESNEENNIAMKTLNVSIVDETVDLYITYNDITFNPAFPTEGDPVIINAVIHNGGSIQAPSTGSGSILVRFYLGDPEAGGTQIGSNITIPVISARSTSPVNVAWDSTGHAGNNEIYVEIDPLDAITETVESNNKAFNTVKVAANTGPDLEIISADINYTPLIPLSGDIVTITAVVENIGNEDASAVLVEFSNGDPTIGGTLILGSQTIPLIAQGDSATAEITWNTAGFSGNYELYVNVDPFNEIAELDELNNTAHQPIEITVPQGPDLTIPEIDTANLIIDTQTLQVSGSIDVTLENAGNQDTVSSFDLTVFEDRNGNETLDAGIDNILGQAVYQANLVYQTTDIINITLTGEVLFRDNLIYVLADSNNSIDELNETNNMRNTGQECEYIPPVGSFNPVEKWTWTGSDVLPQYNQVMQTPAVANLTDDNGDGLINEQDIPDVIFSTFISGYDYCTGVLRAVSGDTGDEIFTVTDPAYKVSTCGVISVGDIDNDGKIEIVMPYVGGGGLIVFEHDGTFKWKYNPMYVEWGGPSIADIDNDGQPEIIAGATVLNNDGTLKWHGTAGIGSNTLGPLSIIADIDLDSMPELVAGNTVYENDGTILWSNTSISDGFNAIANFDDDPYPEIVLVTNGLVYLFEHNGAIIWGPEPIPFGGRGGAPTIADFDGDGEPEIGVAGRTRYVVFDTNGDILWESIIRDYSSNLTGSSVFDFDGDGKAEVVYNDERHLRVYDGSNGMVIFETPNSSWTLIENPIIVDVDNDNRAEIVVGSNSSGPYKTHNGIRVFEDANDNWVNTRKIWNQHSYHITNVNDDGTIPQHEENNWETYNNYRCNSLLPEEVTRSSDITASYVTVDQSSYPASVSVSARIGNGGAVSHPAGVEINFYDGDPAQGGTLIGTANTSETIEKGNYEDVSILWASPAEGEHNVYVIADEANAFNECREDNNTDSILINIDGGALLPVDKPDLEISPSDITIIPPDTIEGQIAVISAVIHNIGPSTSSGLITVHFYDGDPQSGGVLVDAVSISALDAGASAPAEAVWDTMGQTGINYIHVIIDKDNLISELNENNNASLIQVEVLAPVKPDLTISTNDIVFSNQTPKEGDPLILTATIHNFGTDAGNIKVDLYDGDPESGGILLDTYTRTQILAFGAQADIVFNIDTVDVAGSHSFYVKVDPDNTIDEISETNNIAWNSLTIDESGINLSISTDKTTYTANEDVQITVNIENLINANRSGTLDVKILDLNDNVVSTVTGSQTLDLGPDESKVLNYIWNTDATLYGNYKVYSHFIEDGNVIARADTPITISPVKEIGSKIFTDKISYPANQTVTITSQISSASPNYIFENLQSEVSIVNNLGETLYTESNVIPILVPNQLVEFKNYWNTSTNPKGVYTVNLEVFEGLTVLGISTTTFEILGTSDTGEGLTGTITALPDPVYQGQYETLTYTITNNGNEDITSLKVTVIIVDPDTQEAKNTLETTIDLPLNTTITDNFITSTLNLSPKIHLAILQASSDTITEPKTLASTNFEVKPGIEVTKIIPEVANLLVWVNENCGKDLGQKGHNKDADKECIRLDLIEEILGEAVITDYYIVYDKKDFQTELRNPYYTDFLILGNHYPLEDHFWEELREQVYSGKGLVSSLWLKHGEHHGEDYDPFFGIKFKGYLSGDEHKVELVDSPVSEAGTLDAKGKAVKVEAEEGTTIAGWTHVPYGTGQGTCCDKDNESEYPAIVINEYGKGKAIYYAFDLGLTLNDENYGQLSDLINNSVAYVHKPIDTTAFYPYQLIPVEITIKSLGGAFDLRITETYPAEIRLYGPSTGQWITENPWVTDIHLEPDEIRTILYYALAPDSAGTYMLQTEIGYLEEGTYNFYQNLSLDITVDKNTYNMTEDVISVLNSLSVSKKDSGRRDKAVMYINNVQNRTINSEKDIEENIKDIRKAINSLLSITSADTSDVRLIMDELLKIWQSRYYFQLY